MIKLKLFMLLVLFYNVFKVGASGGEPTGQPSGQPSGEPSGQPSGEPSGQPSGQPTVEPSGQPTMAPSGQPSGEPSGQPSGQPTTEPTMAPSGQPSGQPTGQPTTAPSGQATFPCNNSCNSENFHDYLKTGSIATERAIGCCLSGASFIFTSDFDLTNFDFTGSDLSNMGMVSISSGTKLQYAKFNYVDLRGTRFTNSKEFYQSMKETSFINAVLDVNTFGANPYTTYNDDSYTYDDFTPCSSADINCGLYDLCCDSVHNKYLYTCAWYSYLYFGMHTVCDSREAFSYHSVNGDTAGCCLRGASDLFPSFGTFENFDFRGADLSGMGAVHINGNMRGAQFDGADLRGTFFYSDFSLMDHPDDALLPDDYLYSSETSFIGAKIDKGPIYYNIYGSWGEYNMFARTVSPIDNVSFCTDDADCHPSMHCNVFQWKCEVTIDPTGQPTGQPSGQPTGEPSGQPSGQPSGEPSGQPTGEPSGQPTGQPSGQPTPEPTMPPTCPGCCNQLEFLNINGECEPLSCVNANQYRRFDGVCVDLPTMPPVDPPTDGEQDDDSTVVDCNPGEYVKYKGSPSEICEQCVPGKFDLTKTGRNKSCARCKPGYYQNMKGQSECFKCPEGFWTRNQKGKKQCFHENTGKSMSALGMFD